MSDLSLSPLEGLLLLVNAQTTAPVTKDDLMEIFPPEIISGAGVDEPNTKVTLKTTLEFTHAGRVTVSYKRLDLGDLATFNLDASVEETATAEEFLNQLNQRYGLSLSLSDITPTLPFDVSDGNSPYVIEFAAKPDSLMWVGSGNFTANVIWNFDPPEEIEANVERLHTLIHTTLSNSITSFMQS